MLMEKERQEIVDYGKKMSSAGLSKGTSGNISAYDPVCGYMAISPSGLDYFETAAEDIVILDLNGNLIEGSRKPSSEHALHATIYKLHPDARGVVHAHSTYCTTFACLKQPIEAVHYLLAGAQTSCVPCADYATYGTYVPGFSGLHGILSPGLKSDILRGNFPLLKTASQVP